MLTLKEHKYASRCALKVIDFALTSNGANCERFVDIRGLKTLMPLLGSAPAPPPAFVKGKVRVRVGVRVRVRVWVRVGVRVRVRVRVS